MPITPDNAPAGWGSYFAFLISWEGSVFENDPNDPGGATKYGIDARSHPGVSIADLTAAQASQLQLADFRRTPAMLLPYPINYAYFDFAMNAGRYAATKAAQEVVGVKSDGVYGPITASAVETWMAKNGEATYLLKFCALRADYYRALAAKNPGDREYLAGWLNRTTACQTFCSLRIGGNGK